MVIKKTDLGYNGNPNLPKAGTKLDWTMNQLPTDIMKYAILFSIFLNVCQATVLLGLVQLIDKCAK